MALVGVSSGAVQFMAYEQMKNFAFARKKRKTIASGKQWKEGEEKLVCRRSNISDAINSVFSIHRAIQPIPFSQRAQNW